jgi:putative transferase (TIGR04331 family)
VSNNSKASILLVTTALERTWGSDEKILFLGEWCKLYNRKDIWLSRNSQTLSDPWSDRGRRFNAYEFTEEVYKVALVSLAHSLNKKHNLNYPIRYWKILCGPWLRSFINSTYHYWECISDVIDNNKIIDTIEIQEHFKSHIPIDMADFENNMATDYWVHYIISSVINSRESKINSRVITEKIKNRSFKLIHRQQKGIKSLFLEKFFKILCHLFNKPTSVLLLNPYLTIIKIIKLGIKLRTTPSFTFRSDLVHQYDYDKDFRITLQPSQNIFLDYEIFLYKILLHNIPFMYVEGFHDLNKLSKKNKWPEFPSSIVTAAEHSSNDVFKCYTANKVILGSKLNIISHGGGGKYKYSDFQIMELDLCDNYFTWGWTEYSSKCIQGFFIKDFGYKRNGNRDEKHLVHVVLSHYRYTKYLDAFPTYEQYIGGYIEDQIVFLNNLKKNIKDNVITKLSYDYENSLESRFNEKCTNLHFSRQGENYNKLIKNAKIVVLTYNCTTPVECIAMNIPTIIFWDQKHWELVQSAIPFFESLRQCGVFHDSPDSAAIMVQKIWDDVDGWWQSEEVQLACNEFRAWFARDSQNQIKQLSDFCVL